jgi:hypothetical protein
MYILPPPSFFFFFFSFFYLFFTTTHVLHFFFFFFLFSFLFFPHHSRTPLPFFFLFFSTSPSQVVSQVTMPASTPTILPIITVKLGPTHRFPGRNPLNLQTWLRPPLHGQTRVPPLLVGFHVLLLFVFCFFFNFVNCIVWFLRKFYQEN